MHDVAVIGAGPAGLTAALALARQGRRVVVIEAGPVVGGMARSEQVDGIRVDLGSHRLHPVAGPEVTALYRELLGDDLRERPRNGRIHVAGRWFRFPLAAGELVRGLPPRHTARLARDAVSGPFRRPAADTYGEVVRAGPGPTVAELVYDPFARKLWGASPDDLHGDLARRRIAARSPWDIAARLLPGRTRGRTFLYPRGGFGQLTEALAEAACTAGATIRTSTVVRHAALRADGVTLGLAATDGSDRDPGGGSSTGGTGAVHREEPGGETIDAAWLWSTAPPSVLTRLVDAPDEVRDAAARLRHRALVLVYVVLEGRPYTSFDAHYVPALATSFARLSEPTNYREHAGDPADRTVLCAEVPCDVGDEIWRADPDDLAALVADDAARLGLPQIVPSAVEVRRLPRVYPVFTPDYADDLATVEAWASSLPRLLVLGRQGLFVTDNTHHVMAMGLRAAEALRPDGRLDTDAWQRSLTQFAAHVVED